MDIRRLRTIALFSTVAFVSTSALHAQNFNEVKWIRDKSNTPVQDFRINSEQKDFNEVGIVQCHDDQTGSKGVFSIYQIRRSGTKYYFGVQGDTTQASNNYSDFEPVEIELDKWYGLHLQTYTKGQKSSSERGRLWYDGEKIWDNTLTGGGDKESYYKLGAYRLGGGSGKVSVSFEGIRFYTGREKKK